MRSNRHLVVLAGACVCFGAAWADASDLDTICYSDAVDDVLASSTQELVVSQFDPALGTLDLVTVQIALSQGSTVKAELLNLQEPGTYVYDLSWDVTMTGAGATTLLQLTDAGSSSGSLTAFDGLQDYAGTSGFTDTYASNASDTLAYTEPSPEFYSFIGTGSLSYLVDAVSQLVLSGTGAPLVGGHETHVSASVEVCYQFVPIPEPAALVFFATGSLLALRWRHRA